MNSEAEKSGMERVKVNHVPQKTPITSEANIKLANSIAFNFMEQHAKESCREKSGTRFILSKPAGSESYYSFLLPNMKLCATRRARKLIEPPLCKTDSYFKPMSN